MNRIKEITLNLPMRGRSYAVGREVSVAELPKEFRKVTKIEENSIEYEDSIEFIYHIYVENQLYKTIVNSPVTITYFLEGEQ